MALIRAWLSGRSTNGGSEITELGKLAAGDGSFTAIGGNSHPPKPPSRGLFSFTDNRHACSVEHPPEVLPQRLACVLQKR